MSVDDVAWKVGFSDSANLRRAIRRWTGGYGQRHSIEIVCRCLANRVG